MSRAPAAELIASVPHDVARRALTVGAAAIVTAARIVHGLTTDQPLRFWALISRETLEFLPTLSFEVYTTMTSFHVSSWSWRIRRRQRSSCDHFDRALARHPSPPFPGRYSETAVYESGEDDDDADYHEDDHVVFQGGVA